MAYQQYGGNVLEALARNLQQKEQERLVNEERARGERLNIPGGLAGLFAGGLQSGKLFDQSQNRFDLSGLLSPEAMQGGLAGSVQPVSDSLKDVFMGGLGGLKQAQEYQKGQRDILKENQKQKLEERKSEAEINKMEAETNKLKTEQKVQGGIKSFEMPTVDPGKNMQWIRTGQYPDGSFRWESRSKTGGININYNMPPMGE